MGDRRTPPLYLDENVSLQLAALLDARGYDIETAWHLGTMGAEDQEQFAIAVRSQRVLITHDRADFRPLHRAWRSWFAEWGTRPLPRHAGILIIPQHPVLRADEVADVIDQFIQSDVAAGGIANRFFAWTREDGWQEEV